MPINTELTLVPAYATKYFFEYFWRRHMCRRHVNKIVLNLTKDAALKDVMLAINLSISSDNTFCYIQIDVPPEVREQTEQLQLMSYAESILIEYLQHIRSLESSKNSYLLNESFNTMGITQQSNIPFVLFECEDFPKFLAILNNFNKVIAFSILHVFSIIFILIILFKTIL
jgi:hypothetical protein